MHMHYLTLVPTNSVTFILRVWGQNICEHITQNTQSNKDKLNYLCISKVASIGHALLQIKNNSGYDFDSWSNMDIFIYRYVSVCHTNIHTQT